MTRIDSKRLAVLPLTLLLALGASAAAGAEGGTTASPSEKVLATMRAAIERSPETALRVAELEAEVAEMRSTTGAGAPTLSWQREGIGPGFEQRANAVDTLRFSMPFNPPWRRATGKDLRQATDRLLRIGGISGRLEVAALAAGRWLDLAAETEMAALAETRVGRLDRTLAIQTRRYELGEISGSERAQLELELARDRDLLRQSESRRFAVEQQLAALAPGGFPLPDAGDLARLVEQTAAAQPDAGALEAMLDEAPLQQLAEIRNEVAGAEARVQRHGVWGRPEIEFEWERIPDLAPAAGFDAAGVRIAVPLRFGSEGRQRLVASEKRLEAAGAQRDLHERQLVARLHAARETAAATTAALSSLRATADQLADREHSLAEQFRLGAVSYLVYLDGLSRVDDVRRALIETRYSLLTARLELARLLGTDTWFPLPEPIPASPAGASGLEGS